MTTRTALRTRITHYLLCAATGLLSVPVLSQSATAQQTTTAQTPAAALRAQRAPRLFRIPIGLKTAAPANDAASTPTSQAPALAPVQQVQAQSTSHGDSALNRELQKLYSQNGQAMPPMTLNGAPNTQLRGSAQIRRVQPGQQPVKKPGFFGRIFGRKRKQPAQPARRVVQPQPQQRVVQPQPQRRVVRPQQQPQPRSVQSQPSSRTVQPRVVQTQPQPRAVRSQPARVPQAVKQSELRPVQPVATKPEVRRPSVLSAARRPAVQTAVNQKTQPAPVEKVAAPTSTKLVAGTVDDDFDPFTEVSETQADQSAADPYTGLTLDADAPASKKTVDVRPTPTAVAQPKVEKRRAGTTSSREPAANGKMRLITARSHLNGFRGFCPVVLRDERELVDSDPQFTSTFEGREYAFSSTAAKQRFDAAPEKYAPVAGANDVILQGHLGRDTPGSIAHAVWYKNRLHMFANQDSMETFLETLADAKPE